MVKNLPVMQETWVQSLGQEDPLEQGMATCSSMQDRAREAQSKQVLKLVPGFLLTGRPWGGSFLQVLPRGSPNMM